MAEADAYYSHAVVSESAAGVFD
jgi:hypothetical protein